MTQANLTTTPAQVFYEEVAFRPLGTRVVAVVEDGELERRPSGLFLPAKDREKPLLARVVEVGAGVKEIETRDLVIFERYAGAEIRSTNKPAVLILEEADIMAIVERGGRFLHEEYLLRYKAIVDDIQERRKKRLSSAANELRIVDATIDCGLAGGL